MDNDNTIKLSPRKVKKRWPLFLRILIIVFLLIVMAGGYSLAYGYYYVK